MKYTLVLIRVTALLLTCSLILCSNSSSQMISSPDGNISLEFSLDSLNTPNYRVFFKGSAIIEHSAMRFDFENTPPFSINWKVTSTKQSSSRETWELPWGEKRLVNDNHNMLRINLKEANSLERQLSIVFKVFNDGVGFRYEFPEQEGISEVLIANENTEFNLTGNHKCWWIPGDWDIYEHLYTASNFTNIDAISKRDHKSLAQSYIPINAVNTPVTMRTKDGVHLSFHEANLTDYSGMTLSIDKKNLKMTSNLVGSKRNSYKVKRTLPFSSPWRTIQISSTAAGLIESDLILNLNEPNKIGDISWFKPTKYMGIWWEMHLSKSTWDYAQTQDMNSFSKALPHGKHGATTENAKRFIDFASHNNIGALLVEGWNTGWEHWIGFEDREGVFDFVTPYPDYDLKEVVRYGKEKGVEIIMHHETSAAPRTYDLQMDTAYKLMKSLGIHSVKTGYVGKIIPKGEYHHGQWMVNHYRRAIETSAKYNVAINAHEPIKATGIRRTYPNAISREGVRGQEFNAWAADGGNPPNHLPTVAFTRMLAGPIDYTPGIFNIKLTPYKTKNQVNTTLAHQLALYVVIYSPIQMAADLIESYEKNAAFQFIRDVGVDWEDSKVLNGEIGEFVTIAREEKNSGNWFVGAITNEDKRNLNIDFMFLEPNTKYKATIYKDGKNAHWNDNPTEFTIEETLMTNTSKLNLILAPGGGAAISLIKIKK